MQTFLPYPSYKESVACLDWQRLGKQRAEAKQMLLALIQGPKVLRNPATKQVLWGVPLDQAPEGFVVVNTPWFNHSCTRMWEGFEVGLAKYGFETCEEWKKRGYQDNTQAFFAERGGANSFSAPPYWLGNMDFHRSHQSNLVRKKPEHYRKFFPDVPDDIPYVWPSSKPPVW